MGQVLALTGKSQRADNFVPIARYGMFGFGGHNCRFSAI
jgi:hypothetical protein